MKRCFVLVAIVTILAAFPAVPAAQSDTYTARLGWVPTTPTDRPNVTGKGTATAALTGRTLTVSGAFEGLAAPATVARLHRGMAKGARGPSIADLTITQGASGKLSGSVTLTAEQVEDLKQGKLYVQIHSATGVAPDGSTLWGWLLK